MLAELEGALFEELRTNTHLRMFVESRFGLPLSVMRGDEDIQAPPLLAVTLTRAAYSAGSHGGEAAFSLLFLLPLTGEEDLVWCYRLADAVAPVLRRVKGARAGVLTSVELAGISPPEEGSSEWAVEITAAFGF